MASYLPSDLTDYAQTDPVPTQTLTYFFYVVMYGATAFIIFAFSDSIFLWAGLYDRAPTPDRVVFNQNDDRMFF